MATIGTMGTWIDPLTKMGYSGPKKKEDDMPADPKTGKLLSSASLTGTLNTGGATETTGKTIPETSPDKLSMFRDLLKTVTARAAQEAKASGATALPEGMLKPEQVSGNTFAGILNLVSTEKTRGISDIYKSTTDLLDRQQADADKQLQMLINTGAIADMKDTELTRLAESTHTPIDYLKQVRTAKQKSATGAGSESAVEDASTYVDMVLTGQMDIVNVPTGDGMRAEVGRQLNKVYANPIANRVEVYKGKKAKWLQEGKASAYPDPGTREDLIREIKVAYPEYETDEIKQVVYALVPDVWEFNIQKRWQPKATEDINFVEGEGE